MPVRSSDYRAAVWDLLKGGRWHTGLELVGVGGMRAPARVHELRHVESRRILCKVEDSRSSYRYVCDCGALPEPLTTETRFCRVCLAVLDELGARPPGATPTPAPEPHAEQLGLFAPGTP